MVMIQFFSQVLPSSGEKACSQRAPVRVMFDHVRDLQEGPQRGHYALHDPESISDRKAIVGHERSRPGAIPAMAPWVGN